MYTCISVVTGSESTETILKKFLKFPQSKIWISDIHSFHSDSAVKNLPAMQETRQKCGLHPWVRKIPWRRKWQPSPAVLPGKSYGQRSLAGYSPWGHKEPHMTKQLNSNNKQPFTCNIHCIYNYLNNNNTV